MLTYGIPPGFRGGVHMKPPYAIGSVPSLSGHAVAYRWRSLPRVRRHRASKPQGSSERVLPWQITMDQLVFASLSHTHYWYEVGMLKVPSSVSRNLSRRRTVSRNQHKPVNKRCTHLFSFARVFLPTRAPPRLETEVVTPLHLTPRHHRQQ